MEQQGSWRGVKYRYTPPQPITTFFRTSTRDTADCQSDHSALVCHIQQTTHTSYSGLDNIHVSVQVAMVTTSITRYVSVQVSMVTSSTTRYVSVQISMVTSSTTRYVSVQVYMVTSSITRYVSVHVSMVTSNTTRYVSVQVSMVTILVMSVSV